MKELKDGKKHKLGDAPMESPLNFKNHQASKLGDAQGIPSSSSTIIRSSYALDVAKASEKLDIWHCT